jgi:heparan-alpha-glucosaminide N-acetyltransferase
MATTQLTAVPVGEPFQQEEVTSRPKQSGARLVSLDAYRGFIMLMLVSEGFGFGALKGHASWAWLARQFDHAPWEGCTFWDLIQPAFTFMVSPCSAIFSGARSF